jgi:predicted Zn-ribbon and HTH transcriptional regulator
MAIEKLKCNRCKHEWYPRSESIPLECPKCKSPYWNKPRIREHKEVSPSID